MSERSTDTVPEPIPATDGEVPPAPPNDPDTPATNANDHPSEAAAPAPDDTVEPAPPTGESEPEQTAGEPAPVTGGSGTEAAIDSAGPVTGKSDSVDGGLESASDIPVSAVVDPVAKPAEADVVEVVLDEASAAVLMAAEAAASAASAAEAAAEAAAVAAAAATEAARAAAVAADLAAIAATGHTAVPAPADDDMTEAGAKEREEEQEDEGEEEEPQPRARGLARWTSDRRTDLVSYFLVPVVTLIAAPALVAFLGIAILASGSEPPSVCDQVRAINGCEELTWSLIRTHVLGFLVLWAALWALPWWRGLRLPRLALAGAAGLVLFTVVLRMAA